MSTETWQAEFMPTPARVAAQASLAKQLAWCLRKWTGGRFENLEKHRLCIPNHEKPHALRSKEGGLDLMVFCESACPLCLNFRSEFKPYCDGCPMVETSDMLRCGLSASAYTQWFKNLDPEPMIIALGEALARETLRAERTATVGEGKWIVVPAGMDVGKVRYGEELGGKLDVTPAKKVPAAKQEETIWPQYTVVKKKYLGPGSYAYAKWSGPQPTDATYFRTDGTSNNHAPYGCLASYVKHVASSSVWRAATYGEAMYRLRPPDTDQYTVAESVQIVRDGEAYLTMNGVSGKVVDIVHRDGQKFDPNPNFGDGLRWTVKMKTSEDKLNVTGFHDDQPVHVSKKDGDPKLWDAPRYLVKSNFAEVPGDYNMAYIKFNGPETQGVSVSVTGVVASGSTSTWNDYKANHCGWEEAPKELALARVRPAFTREYRVPCTECRERYIMTWGGNAEICVAIKPPRPERDGGRRWIFEPSRCSKCGRQKRNQA